MIEKNIRLQPHHSRDLLVGRRSDGRRPGYQPPGGGATSMGSGRDAPSRSSDRGGHSHHATANVTSRPDPTPAAPDRQDRARQQAVVEKKHQEATAIAEYAIREAKRIKETKPAHLGDTGGSLLTKKPTIDTGPKRDMHDFEIKKRKIKTITGGNPFIDDVYEKKIVYEPSDLPKRAYDPRTDPNALLKRPGGILSTIGGGLKKVFGETPLEWGLNLASMGGYEKAKYAKAMLDLKNRKGKYGTALKFLEDKTGKKLSLASTQHLKRRPKDMPEHLGERGFKTRVDTPTQDGDGIQTAITGDKGLLTEGAKTLGITDEQREQYLLMQNKMKMALDQGSYTNEQGQVIQLNEQQLDQLQKYIDNLNNILQTTLQKDQTPMGAAHGGRIDGPLMGGSRYI